MWCVQRLLRRVMYVVCAETAVESDVSGVRKDGCG